MESKINEENNISQKSLIANSANNSNSNIISSSKNKLLNILVKYLSQNDKSLYLKTKYFYQWKNQQNNTNNISIQILKFKPRRLQFTSPIDSTKKNKDMRNLLKGKFIANLINSINMKNDELKYFFEKWKSKIYINKSKNYKFRKIKKIKILPKLKSSEIIFPKSNDAIYNNIINILNKISKSQRKKELLSILNKIEEIEKNNILKTYNSNDSFASLKEEKNIKNKITERAFNKLENAVKKTDIKQKYFNKWKQLTTFTIKSNKSIKRLNRIIFTKKKKEIDSDVKSIKTYKTTIPEKNELNDYVISLYKKSSKNDQGHIKNIILEILKLFGENMSEICTPSTPFNDSSFSYSCYDINTERSEEESVTSTTMKNISKRVIKKLRNIFKKNDVKMAYFKKWKENIKINNSKKIRKRLVLNKKEKESLMKKFITSNIFTRNKKYDINYINSNNQDKKDEKISISVNKENPSKQNDFNQSIVKNLNDYLNSNEELSEMEGFTDNDKNEKNKEDKIIFEMMEKSDITPRKRNTEHFRFKTDYKLDIESSFDNPNKISRYSATPGRYKMSFKKVFYTRNKNFNSQSQNSSEKKTFNKKLKNIFKYLDKNKLKKYFDTWKSNNDNQNLDDEDKEDILEIIKTNDIKLEKSNKKEEKNEEDKEIKGKNSSLNGIYGLCYTEDFTNNKNKEEYISIYGNKKSENINQNIEPHFTDFLKAMNCSIATFNLFTFYSQFHDNKFLIKKKFLPFWRNIKSF